MAKRSEEQKKKDRRVADRKKVADEKKRKAEKAKRPQGFEGGKAAPKDRDPATTRSVYRGEREIHDREYNPNYGLFGSGGTRTKRSWAGLPGRKTDVENVRGGKYRGADWPAISTYGAEQRAIENPDPGAHRGQSVGPHYKRAKSRKAGGKVGLGPKMARKKAYNSGGQVKLGLKPTNKTTVTAKGMGAAKRGGNFKV